MRARSSRTIVQPSDQGWRIWFPHADQYAREGNPCFGIALAVLLSLPIWLVVGLLTFAVGY
jgi:hypothetical protein